MIVPSFFQQREESWITLSDPYRGKMGKLNHADAKTLLWLIVMVRSSKWKPH